jgi:PA domain-containing protein
MRSPFSRLIALTAALAVVVVLPAVASAKPPTPPQAVSTYTWSPNLEPLGHSARNVPLENASPVDGIINSDLAFWGDKAFQGTYEGFRIIDISNAKKPREILNYADCMAGTTEGNQGDLVVWDDILVRSWNSESDADDTCAGELVGAGFEGFHVFDISDLRNPQLVASIQLADLGALPLQVTFGSSTFQAAGASFGPPPTFEGFTGNAVLANDGVATAPAGTTTDACEPLVGFPAGAIAVVDRGTCDFSVKALNAQQAGASAVIVADNQPGVPTTMGVGAVGNDVTIPAVRLSQADGNALKATLPVNVSVSRREEYGCGSHTASGAPDRRNDRLLVYNSSSDEDCPFFEVLEVPFDAPEDAQVINRVDSMHTCHDIGIILGSARRLACAGGAGARIFSLDQRDGGSLTEPMLMHHFDIEGVDIGHSAAWSWDGEVLIFGHEPGGGTQARCEESDTLVDRTLYFYDHEGNQLGTFVQPRPQTALENCTWHNYNVVPTRNGKRILVTGNYQMGISVIDFTNPAMPQQIAFADPAPLVDPDPPVGIEQGGDWSSYWYDGEIYESDMTRGLTIWQLNDRRVKGAKKLGHLNPQTQELTITEDDSDSDSDSD